MATTGDLDIPTESQRLLDWSQRLLDEATSHRTASSRDPVSLQRASSNTKLAPQRTEIARSGRPRHVPIGPYVASTYVSITATCPSSCQWKDNGCYAQTGLTSATVSARDRAGRRMSALEVTRRESEVVDSTYTRGVPQDGARGGRDLRLHVSGDVSCSKGAGLLAAAARRWSERGGGSVWTFTHRWRDIPQPAWGTISALASVDHPNDLRESIRLGYAPAIVLDDFPEGDRAFDLGGVRLVPCPYQTRGRTCVECRLCLDQGRMAKKRTGVAFRFHGPQREPGKVQLRVLQSSSR